MSETAIDESKLGPVKGKVAIVTGGASGIGESLVKLLHKHGAAVFFCDVNAAGGEQLAKQLGPNVDFEKVDVLVWKELRAFFKHAKDKHGRIDIVFANAGINQAMDIFQDHLDEDGELLEPEMPVIDVNLKSVAATSKLALSYFKSNSPPGGCLVMTCSTAGYNARPNIPLYSAAKHGVAGLMRALSGNAPDSGNSVSCIAPGATATAILDAKAQAAYRSLGIPVQEPEFVALAGLYLASNPRECNGFGLCLIGERATECERALTETQPLWYGQYNYDMASKAAAVSFKR